VCVHGVYVCELKHHMVIQRQCYATHFKTRMSDVAIHYNLQP